MNKGQSLAVIRVVRAAAYLALPCVIAVGGSWIVERKLILEKNWSAITKLTKEALAMVGARK